METSNIFSCLKKQDKRLKIKEVEESTDVNSSTELKGYVLQFFANSSVYLLMMEHGVHAAWTSPALPHLTGKNSEFPVTVSQGGWIASLFSLSVIFGIMLCPLFMDRIGRKYTMLVFFLPRLLSWILIIFAKSYITLYIARLIGGAGTGGLYTITAVYIGEIADKKIRGALLTSLIISLNIGIFIVAVAGAYLTYNAMNLAMLVIPVCFLILFLFTPETPYFYLMQGRDVRAIRTLMKLRGEKNPDAVMEDIERMKKGIVQGRRLRRSTTHQLFENRGCRKAIIILLFAKAAFLYSGFLAIVAYAQEILSHTGSSMKATDAAMILGATEILAGLPATQLIDRTGRRIMFLISGALTSLALGCLGMFFFCKIHLELDVSAVTWIPLAGLVFFKIVSNIGLNSIPTIFMGELLPIKLKAPALALTNVFTGIYGFTSKLAFQALTSAFGIYVSFWFFGVVCISAVLVVFFITPETTGKNLEEIQLMLNGAKGKSSARKTDLS